MKARYLACLLLFFLPALASFAFADELIIEIDRLSENPEKSVRLGDVARLSGPQEIVTLAKNVTVGIRQGYLWRSDVVAALVNQGVGSVTLRLLMPPKIAAGKSESIPDLETLLLKLSGWDGVVHIRGSTQVPAGELIAPSRIRPGATSVILRVRTAKGIRDVPVSLEWFQKVVMTRRIVENGTVLTPEDIEVRQVHISSPLDAASDVSQVVGRMLNRRLAAGDRVSINFLLMPPVLKRGDKVFIVVRKGALFLRIPGEILEDGAVGEKIRVRNLQSKKIIEASVLSRDEVEVRIQ